MKKLVGLITGAFIYFCVATLIAQSVAIGVVWSKGLLSRDRLYKMLAGLHGIEPSASETAAAQAKPAKPEDVEQPSYEDVINRRAKQGLDLALRDTAIEKGLAELRSLEEEFKTQRRRYDELRESFEVRLANLQSSAKDSALQEVQRTIETIAPKQAKDQLLRMLDDKSMDQVVAILKSMPTDKRKKILAEFKSGEEAERLFEVLKEIRSGAGEERLIENTRDKLKQFNGPQS